MREIAVSVRRSVVEVHVSVRRSVRKVDILERRPVSEVSIHLIHDPLDYDVKTEALVTMFSRICLRSAFSCLSVK